MINIIMAKSEIEQFDHLEEIEDSKEQGYFSDNLRSLMRNYFCDEPVPTGKEITKTTIRFLKKEIQNLEDDLACAEESDCQGESENKGENVYIEHREEEEATW